MTDVEHTTSAAVTKAVIPAAGMGTRFLPATKSVPKEMFPIVDRPVLQFVVEEAIAAGVNQILMVTRSGKNAIGDYFEPDAVLDTFLGDTSREQHIESIRDIQRRCEITYVEQAEPRGLGDAVNLARSFAGEDPLAVLLGDAIVQPHDNAPGGLQQLADVYAQRQSPVVAVEHVPSDRISRYGIVDGEPVDADTPDMWRVRQLVEKPSASEAPSDLAIAGRYILTPDIFDLLDGTARGTGGEIQLTDAMCRLAADRPLYALCWRARRYDLGSRLEFVTCLLDHALQRADIGPAVRSYLQRVGADASGRPGAGTEMA